MKKTVQTVMTAAMFAATMNMIPSGTSDGTVSVSAVDYNPVAEEMQDVYGPPVTSPESVQTTYAVYGPPIAWDTETEPVETVTAPPNTDPVAVYGPPIAWNTKTEPVKTVPATTAYDPLGNQTTYAVYGPPIAWNTTTVPTEIPVPNTIPLPVYGPPIAWVGDLNEDNRIDVFDMIELRKAYLNGTTGEDWIDLFKADINQDGEIGIADLVMLQNYLLGRTKKIYDNQLEEPKPTAPQVSYEPVQSTTKNTTTEPVPQPEYGAPVAFD